MLKNTRLVFLIASSFASSVVFAARPMMTDDARIVDPQSCQLESWVKTYQHHNEYWALPVPVDRYRPTSCQPWREPYGHPKIGRAHV